MTNFVDRIVADRWRGVHCDEHETRSPSIADVYLAIEALDAQTRTIVSLRGQKGSYLSIGGGRGSYVVYVSTSEGQFWNLLSTRIDDKELIRLNAGGQEGDFSARQVVDKDRALKAAGTFFRSGGLDADLLWEQQSSH